MYFKKHNINLPISTVKSVKYRNLGSNILQLSEFLTKSILILPYQFSIFFMSILHISLKKSTIKKKLKLKLIHLFIFLNTCYMWAQCTFIYYIVYIFLKHGLLIKKTTRCVRKYQLFILYFFLTKF